MIYDVDTLDEQYFKVNYMAYYFKDKKYSVSNLGYVNSVVRFKRNEWADDLPLKDEVFAHNTVVPFTKNAQASFYIIDGNNKS